MSSKGRSLRLPQMLICIGDSLRLENVLCFAGKTVSYLQDRCVIGVELVASLQKSPGVLLVTLCLLKHGPCQVDVTRARARLHV